jgi:hypothetical protein
MRFRTALKLAGKTATGLEVPEHVVTGLGRGKRPPMHVTINGYTYRSTVAPMGEKFMIPVSAASREAARPSPASESPNGGPRWARSSRRLPLC